MPALQINYKLTTVCTRILYLNDYDNDVYWHGIYLLFIFYFVSCIILSILSLCINH